MVWLLVLLGVTAQRLAAEEMQWVQASDERGSNDDHALAKLRGG